MDLRERTLYHQVHPVKIVTDAISALVSLRLRALHLLAVAVAVLFVPLAPLVAKN